MDFDSAEIQEYPDASERLTQGKLEPGTIMLDGQLQAMDKVSYSRLIEEFEKLGVTRVRQKTQ